jgi:fatty-acyl-CoA synthase
MQIWQQDWLSKWALYSPDKTALKEAETGRTLTYGALNRLGNRLAQAFTATYGIAKGDRVAVLAEFSLEYVALFVAAQKAGFVLVPINYRLAAPEVSHVVGDSTPKLVIVETKFAQLYAAAVPVWSLDDVVALCDRQQSADEPFPVVPVDEDDAILILYTAGTTGLPKGALYTHKMLFWNSINTAISLIVNSESRTLQVMPPFHTGGWNVLLTPFLHHGGYVCMLKKVDPPAILQLLQEERATIFMGVPTILQMIANQPEFEQAAFPDLYYLIVGGEPMPIPLIERWDAKGVPVRQGYGMTEVGPNLFSLHQDDAIRKKGSIGRPNFYVDIRIVDAEGRDVPIDTPGELWLRGPMVTPGYWNNPDGTRQAFSPEGRWFRTGDLVRQDAERYVYVVDRVKNMIKSGGENVYPAEVERVLVRHPAVAEACVVGAPDEKWGEVGRAFLVLKPGAQATFEDVQSFCRDHLAKFKVPKYVEFLTELPKNDAGKLNRQALKARPFTSV